jgi:hypothetical protein
VGREARTVALSGRAGIPTSGVTGLVVTVETARTSRAAVIDVLSPGDGTPVGRLTTSSTGPRSLTVLVPTAGSIVVRGASGTAVPFRIRPVGWLGTAGADALVARVAPTTVVDTQAGIGLRGATSSRVARAFPLSAPGGIPAGSSAALVSLSVKASGSTGTAVLRSKWRGHAVDSVSGVWAHGVVLVPLGTGGDGRLTLPAGAHARVTVLGYVA